MPYTQIREEVTKSPKEFTDKEKELYTSKEHLLNIPVGLSNRMYLLKINKHPNLVCVNVVKKTITFRFRDVKYIMELFARAWKEGIVGGYLMTTKIDEPSYLRVFTKDKEEMVSCVKKLASFLEKDIEENSFLIVDEVVSLLANKNLYV